MVAGSLSIVMAFRGEVIQCIEAKIFEYVSTNTCLQHAILLANALEFMPTSSRCVKYSQVTFRTTAQRSQ